MNRIITLLITLLCLGNVCAQNNKKLVVYQKNGAKVEYKLSEIEKVNIEEIVMVNSISLNKTEARVNKGYTLQLTANVLPTNADNKTVSWKSSNTNVATVSSTGLVTAKGYGTATITATANDGTGVSSTATIIVPSLADVFTVPSGVTLSISNIGTYPWSIDEDNVLTPGNKGKRGSDSYFTATLTSSTPIILKFDWKVSCDDDEDELYCEITDNYENYYDDDYTDERSWVSPSFFIPSGTHKVRFGYRKGVDSWNSGEDMGWIKNIVIGKATPVSSITLNATNITLTQSGTYQLSATTLPENASNKAINWTTSNSTVATVSSNGLVTAKGIGTATITATAADGSGVNAKATITVRDTKINGHEYVDLGLPSGTLWATCNVGASTPEGYGDYYAWGETATKTDYSWSTYMKSWGGNIPSAAYCGYTTDPLKDYVKPNNKSIAGTKYDVAQTKWGSQWKMPSYEQFVELLSNTSGENITINGISGKKYTAANGNSIFFPYATVWEDTDKPTGGTNGYYWTGSPYEAQASKAYCVEIYSTQLFYGKEYRSIGMPIRPVVSE